MRLTLLALLATLGAPDEKQDLKKTGEKTAAVTSYLEQWNQELTIRGKPSTQGGASEFVAPSLITYKSSTIEIVKKGDAAMSKTKDGWVKAEDDRRVKAIAAGLKPPHEPLLALLEKIEAPKKGKDGDHNKVKCSTITGTLPGGALRDYLKAVDTRFATLERLINWTDSKVTVEVLVNAKEGWLEKVTLQGDLQSILKLNGVDTTMPLKRTVEFFSQNKDTPDIAPEVKKALDIEDPKEGGDKP